MTTTALSDQREALYNDQKSGTAGQIQLPCEAVTRLHGLVLDLDANLLRANPWFPPAETAEAFYTGIVPALARHPILRSAEVRDTGRWLHLLCLFAEPVELLTAADQERWKAMHRVLMGSVPSDPAGHPLIALTRPIGSINSKTGGEVRTLRQGTPIPAGDLEAWVSDAQFKPFEEIGLILFGDRRVSPCPFCRAEGSHLDLGEKAGHCYGRCRQVPLRRLFDPFFAEFDGKEKTTTGRRSAGKGTAKRQTDGTGTVPEVLRIDRDVVLEIDPARVITLTIRGTGK